MEKLNKNTFVQLGTEVPIWNRFFTIAPLIVVGTKEGTGYDLAPKHMATPLGTSNYFGFVCTPRHTTYHNIKKTKEFAVSFPVPDQVLLTSLSASPRLANCEKSTGIVSSMPTVKAATVDALFIKNSYLNLECELFKIIDGFDKHSLITAKVIAAYVHSDYLRVSERGDQEQIKKHPLLAYISEGRFATITDTYNFPFPKGFKR